MVAFAAPVSTATDQILSDEFQIHDQGLTFQCTACGHIETNGFGARLMRLDDLTIIGTGVLYFMRWIPVEIDCEDQLFCERRLQQFFEDVANAALWAAHRKQSAS